MAAYISTKKSLLRFFVSFGVAALALIPLNYFMRGPRLGPHYDMLMRSRQSPRVSRELLLIETGVSGEGQGAADPSDNIIEPSVLASVLMALTELDAAALIVQAPVLGVSPGIGGVEDEFLLRLEAEFSLLESNIHNLFEAIRIGSIPPGESSRYVGDLIGLAERGKERLVSTLIRTDEAGMLFFQEAAAAFGNVWEADDLRVRLIRSGAAREAGPEASALPSATPVEDADIRWYSKPRLDPDGVFRRIAPVLGDDRKTEHILYAALKGRFEPAGVEDSDRGPVLRLRRDGTDTALPLDSRGAVLADMPRNGADFKRLPLETFIAYQAADKDLYRMLVEAEALGFYESLAPEAYPSFLYQYADSLREDMLKAPTGEKKARWLEARKGYLQALEVFFYGPTEMDLVAGYEKLMRSETLGEEGIGRIIALRDELSSHFMNIRVRYGELLETRKVLQDGAASSLCILGGGRAGEGPSDIEASAVLANSILTGQVVIPLADRYVLFWSLAAALLCAFLLRKWGPAASLITGLLLICLTALVFIAGFIFTPYWIDPVVPLSGVSGAVFSSFACALLLKRQNADYFRRVYGPIIMPAYLRQVIRARRPLLSETLTAKAAVVAVRYGGFMAAENRSEPRVSAQAAEAFRKAVSKAFKNAGGTMVGCDGDLVLAAFGSPLERIALGRIKTEVPYEDDAQGRGNHSPAAKAVGFILELLRENPEAAAWRFGIDTGECAFAYSSLAGYGAFGPAAVRARLLSNLAPRYKARIMVTGGVSEKIEGIALRRLDALPDGQGKDREVFYELLVKRD
jgi:class 3 adenylate cyclase